MKKSNLHRKRTEELSRARVILEKNLVDLETSLKQFRSTSPQKWAEEVGSGVDGNRLDSLSSRSSQGTSSEGGTSSEKRISTRTVAENEEFRKQKDKSVENMYGILSPQVMSEGVLCLQEGLRSMQGGINDVQEWLEQADATLCTQEGLRGLQKGFKDVLEEFDDVIANSSGFSGKGLETALGQLKNALEGLKTDGKSSQDLREGLKDVQEKIIQMQDYLLFENNKTCIVSQKGLQGLTDVEQGLMGVLRGLRIQANDKIQKRPGSSNQQNESSFPPSDLFNQFIELDENDFDKISSLIDEDTTQLIALHEEADIAASREKLAETLAQPF